MLQEIAKFFKNSNTSYCSGCDIASHIIEKLLTRNDKMLEIISQCYNSENSEEILNIIEDFYQEEIWIFERE